MSPKRVDGLRAAQPDRGLARYRDVMAEIGDQRGARPVTGPASSTSTCARTKESTPCGPQAMAETPPSPALDEFARTAPGVVTLTRDKVNEMEAEDWPA